MRFICNHDMLSSLVCLLDTLELQHSMSFSFFFFNDTATTEIYTLSLHDALPICSRNVQMHRRVGPWGVALGVAMIVVGVRSEEHTSELQSLRHLVCRLLLEKKKKTKK